VLNLTQIFQLYTIKLMINKCFDIYKANFLFLYGYIKYKQLIRVNSKVNKNNYYIIVTVVYVIIFLILKDLYKYDCILYAVVLILINILSMI